MGGGAEVLGHLADLPVPVAGAAGQGIDCLFVTGGLAWDQFGPEIERPDPALLDAWLRAEGQDPAYAIGRLR